MSRRQFDQALRRAEYRDRKRRTKMKVSGKSTLTLNRLVNKRSK